VQIVDLDVHSTPLCRTADAQVLDVDMARHDRGRRGIVDVERSRILVEQAAEKPGAQEDIGAHEVQRRERERGHEQDAQPLPWTAARFARAFRSRAALGA